MLHRSQCINSIDRELLNNTMLTQMEHLDGVKLHFDHKLQRAHLDKGHLVFNVGTKTAEASADLVVGCDGAYSKVRHQMQRCVRYVASRVPIPVSSLRDCLQDGLFPKLYRSQLSRACHSTGPSQRWRNQVLQSEPASSAHLAATQVHAHRPAQRCALFVSQHLPSLTRVLLCRISPSHAPSLHPKAHSKASKPNRKSSTSFLNTFLMRCRSSVAKPSCTASQSILSALSCDSPARLTTTRTALSFWAIRATACLRSMDRV